jgi:hypothetical protein
MKTARRTTVAITVALAFLVLAWQGIAMAVGGVGDIVGPGSNNQGNEAYSPDVAQPAPPGDPSSDDDSDGHETEDPAKPDHAGGSIAEVSLAGQELIAVGQNNASIDDDGQASGDVVVLAIGGSEIIGAHSNCPAVGCEGGESEGNAPIGLLCEPSGGSVCVELLYGNTTSSTENDESSATADQALVFACIGGSQTTPSEDCAGPVGAGVSENHSVITQDNTNGNTSADQSTDVADVCVGPTGEDPITGTCSGLGASALHSETHSEANSETGNGSTDRSSYLLAVELGGTSLLTISDPTAISLPPGCPEGASLVCVFLNQGESFVYTGGAGSHQEALHLSVLRAIVGGEDVALGHVADAETLAENTGPACPPGATRADCVVTPSCPVGQHRDASGNCVDDQGPGPRGLSDTGLDTLVPVALALALMLLGTNLVAWDRRRSQV